MWIEVDLRIAGGTKGGIRKPSEGSRIIILRVGTENGWVDGAALVFRSKSTRDYYDEIYIHVIYTCI